MINELSSSNCHTRQTVHFSIFYSQLPLFSVEGGLYPHHLKSNYAESSPLECIVEAEFRILFPTHLAYYPLISHFDLFKKASKLFQNITSYKLISRGIGSPRLTAPTKDVSFKPYYIILTYYSLRPSFQ